MVSIGRVGGGITEGDYTSWTLKWANLVPQSVSGSYELDWIIDEKNGHIIIIWQDESNDNRWGIFNISNFSTVSLSAAGSDYTGVIYPYHWMGAMRRGKANFYYSGVGVSHQSYFLLKRKDNYTLEVWRDGARLWSHDIRSDISNPAPEAGGMSLTGKYVLLLVMDYDIGKYRLVLYEGS